MSVGERSSVGALDLGFQAWASCKQLLDVTARDLLNVHSSIVTVLRSLFRAAARRRGYTNATVRVGGGLGPAHGSDAARRSEGVLTKGGFLAVSAGVVIAAAAS